MRLENLLAGRAAGDLLARERACGTVSSRRCCDCNSQTWNYYLIRFFVIQAAFRNRRESGYLVRGRTSPSVTCNGSFVTADLVLCTVVSSR